MEKESFLHDPRIIRCLFFVNEVLEKAAKAQLKYNHKPSTFSITKQEKSQVILPDEKIGVNEFAK
jgi:hypothetical protein